MSTWKSLQEIAEEHWLWVDSVGWHDDKRPLEYLALICSEIGEAVNECRTETIDSDKLGEELADIVLRVLDTALVFNIEIEEAILKKISKNKERGSRGRIK